MFVGSGRSGLYSGTFGSSQPLSPSYGVLPDMREADESSGILDDEGCYVRNPTACRIENMIRGNYIGDKRTNGLFIYVITLNGDIVVGRRNGNGPHGSPTPHPTLIGGRNPRVKMAGMLEIRGGKIFSYDGRSGHFKPNRRSMDVADEAFGRLPSNLFHRKSPRRRR